MSENNCWDHVPSSALLANAILLPRALPCHVHGLRHQHCVQGFSSLIAFQRQGAMMYANPADLVGHCRVTLGLLLLLTSLPCVYLDCTEEQSHLFGSPKCWQVVTSFCSQNKGIGREGAERQESTESPWWCPEPSRRSSDVGLSFSPASSYLASSCSPTGLKWGLGSYTLGTMEWSERQLCSLETLLQPRVSVQHSKIPEVVTLASKLWQIQTLKPPYACNAIYSRFSTFRIDFKRILNTQTMNYPD